MLVHVLNKDKLGADGTNKFAVFVHGESVDNVRLLLTMTKEDFKSMGFDVDFKTFWSPQGLNMLVKLRWLLTE